MGTSSNRKLMNYCNSDYMLMHYMNCGYAYVTETRLHLPVALYICVTVHITVERVWQVNFRDPHCM